MLVDSEQAGKVQTYLDRAEKDGVGVIAKSAYDGIGPVIFDVADKTHPLAHEEIFGPVLSVITVSSFDEAITIANQSAYGLAASVFTSNIKRALRAGKALKAGTVTINSYGEGDATTPFGGYKQSGFGGRDNGLASHDQFTEIKTLWVDLSDDSTDDIA